MMTCLVLYLINLLLLRRYNHEALHDKKTYNPCNSGGGFLNLGVVPVKRIFKLRRIIRVGLGIYLFLLVSFVNSPLCLANFTNILFTIDAGRVHTVVHGDTLYNIARINGTCWEVLASYNHISNPRLIFPGQQIQIPIQDYLLLQELSLEYLLQLFADWGYYLNNYLQHESHIITPREFQYRQRARRAFEEDSQLFLDAVNINPVYGRSLFIGTWFAEYDEMYPYWIKMLPDIYLENNPTAIYIASLISHLSPCNRSEQSPIRYIYNSRVIHAFTHNATAYFEALYFIGAESLSGWIALNILSDYIVRAREANHPILYPKWMNLLQYVALTNTNKYIEQILEILHSNIESEWKRRLSFSTTPNVDAENSRNWFRPDVWTPDFDWVSIRRAGGIAGTIIEGIYLRLAYSLGAVRVLHFPFWIWDETHFSPSCPIWTIATVNYTVQNIAIFELVSHVVELRNDNFDEHQVILSMLTDSSSIFDPKTRDVFERVNYQIVKLLG